MRKYFPLLVLIFFISLTCCSEQRDVVYPNHTKEIFHKDFENTEEKLSSSEVILEHHIHNVRLMEYYKGNLILSQVGSSDSLIRIIPLNNTDKTYHLLEYGDGPDQLQFADLLLFHNDTLQVYDPYQLMSKFFILSRNDEKLSLSEAISTIQAKDLFTDYIFQLKNNFFATQYEKPQSRFAVLAEDGHVKKWIGEYPVHPDSNTISKNLIPFMYPAEPHLKPDQSKFLLRYRSEDLIEIYNPEGDLILSIKGPDHFYSQYALSSNNGNHSPRIIRGKTRRGYLDVDVDDEFIYALYSGSLRYLEDGTRLEDASRSNKIFVFTWEGKPIKKFILDRKVSEIAVDSKKDVIYGVNVEDDHRLFQFKYTSL